MVESYIPHSVSMLTFRGFIGPNETKCCQIADKNCNPTGKTNAKLRFFVFLNEDSLEGCDILGNASSHITLSSYQAFDNCIWNQGGLGD